MVLPVEKAFRRRCRLCWIRQVSAESTLSPPPPSRPAVLALLPLLVLQQGSCCWSTGRRSAPATQQDRSGYPSQTHDRGAGQLSRVRPTHPCAAPLADRHGNTRGVPGFHQTDIAIHPLCSSVASVLVTQRATLLMILRRPSSSCLLLFVLLIPRGSRTRRAKA